MVKRNAKVVQTDLMFLNAYLNNTISKKELLDILNRLLAVGGTTLERVTFILEKLVREVKKGRLISTRLEEEDAKVLEEIAKEENVDKATLVRKWILSKITEHRLEKAAEKYRKGLISIEEAAKMANTTIWKFIEYIREKNIWPPFQSKEELEKELEQTKKLLKQDS